jgi:hypothetical protein
MPRPDLKQVPEWYHGYIKLVQGNDFLGEMKKQTPDMIRFLKKIPAAKWNFRYAKGKWTLKDLLQHMIDAERIFAYRALCFARQDQTPLPSFDENMYADNARTAKREWKDMVEELKLVRQANEIMFSSFDKKQLSTIGTASGKQFSVNDIGYIMVGHLAHHLNIIRERYLN